MHAGFGLERYRKLEPFVTALPIGTPINVCTAPPELLDSIVHGPSVARSVDEVSARAARCGGRPRGLRAYCLGCAGGVTTVGCGCICRVAVIELLIAVAMPINS